VLRTAERRRRPNLLFGGSCVSGDESNSGVGETCWSSPFSHRICDDSGEISNDISGEIEISDDISGGGDISGDTSSSSGGGGGGGGGGGKGDVKGAAATVMGKRDSPAVAAVI
jgi:hypothetical protein